ncbi:hypothetical protein GCM10020370_20220 [Paenibacillus hodogayensis]
MRAGVSNEKLQGNGLRESCCTMRFEHRHACRDKAHIRKQARPESDGQQQEAIAETIGFY